MKYMKNYLKNFGKMIIDGFYSIAKGMSSMGYLLPQNKTPNDKESQKKDYEAVKSDWETARNNNTTRIRTIEDFI